MKSKKIIIISIALTICIAFACICAGCDLLSIVANKYSTETQSTSSPSVTVAVSRGTSLTLSGDSLEISRAQLSKQAPMGDEGTRTVLIYLCGTDLESSKDGGLAIADLKEMVAAIKAEPNQNLKVLVQTGGAKRWSDSSVSSKNITRYEVTASGLQQLELLPQANMGDSATLADFLVWGVANYPAEKTDVILWNHGSGSINGVCFDENYDYDSLSVSELDSAFLTAYSNMTCKFESVGFDACLMSTVEVANVLASYSNYMIASEESEAGTGWAYSSILGALASDPTISGAELGKVVADSAYRSLDRSSQKMYTMAVIDLSLIDDVCISLDKTSEDMIAYVQENSASDLVKLIKQAQNYGGNSRSEGYTNMVDLGDMMYNLSSLIPSAANVVEAIEKAVAYSVNGSARTSSKGLAVYYPLKVQGSTEISTFGNICVSPHYLAYLDQTVFGTSVSGGNNNSNQTHNGSSWLLGDYDFWSMMNDFHSYWNDIPDFGNDSYNVIDPSTQDVTIQLLCDPYLDKNGTYTVKISGESLNYLVTVDYALFLKNDDGTKTLIGTDVDVDLTYSSGIAVMRDQFKGHWIALSDGQYLALEVTEETEEYAVYSAPIYINGDRATIKVKRMITDGTPEYEVLGVYGGISQSGAASKTMDNIKDGDVIIPVYYVYQADGSITETQGKEYIVDGEPLELSDVALQNGNYEYCFILTDTTGQDYYTDATVYTIDGDTIYYTSEKTDADTSYSGDVWDFFTNPFGFNFFNTANHGFGHNDFYGHGNQTNNNQNVSGYNQSNTENNPNANENAQIGGQGHSQHQPNANSFDDQSQDAESNQNTVWYFEGQFGNIIPVWILRY